MRSDCGAEVGIDDAAAASPQAKPNRENQIGADNGMGKGPARHRKDQSINIFALGLRCALEAQVFLGVKVGIAAADIKTNTNPASPIESEHTGC